MLYIILMIIIIALVALIAWGVWRHLEEIGESEGRTEYWYNQAEAYRIERDRLSKIKEVKEYEALDQGMTELQDAYETDMLQYQSTIEDLKKLLRDETGFKDDAQTELMHLKDELHDVKQAALEMQIDLQARDEGEPTFEKLLQEENDSAYSNGPRDCGE